MLAIKSALPVLAALSVAACAGGGGGGRSSVPDRYSVRYRADVRGFHYTFEHSADRIVEALPEVYGRLGFPGNLASNSDELVFISPHASAEGRIYEGELNSDYLDCGRGLTGPRADSHILEFVIVTRIIPAGTDASEIEVIVDGSARTREHNLNAVPCEGTGKLEGQIADLLTFMLANR